VRRRQPRSRAIEGGAHDIEVACLLDVERRHADALAARFDQKALAPQEHHRLQHRLAGHAELLSELFLGDASPRFQLAGADGVQNGVVDAFAEVGFGQKKGAWPVYRTQIAESQPPSEFSALWQREPAMRDWDSR